MCVDDGLHCEQEKMGNFRELKLPNIGTIIRRLLSIMIFATAMLQPQDEAGAVDHTVCAMGVAAIRNSGVGSLPTSTLETSICLASEKLVEALSTGDGVGKILCGELLTKTSKEYLTRFPGRNLDDLLPRCRELSRLGR